MIPENHFPFLICLSSFKYAEVEAYLCKQTVATHTRKVMSDLLTEKQLIVSSCSSSTVFSRC